MFYQVQKRYQSSFSEFVAVEGAAVEAAAVRENTEAVHENTEAAVRVAAVEEVTVCNSTLLRARRLQIPRRTLLVPAAGVSVGVSRGT